MQRTPLLLSTLISACLASTSSFATQTEAVLISEAAPVFPLEYKRDEIEGWVQISYVVDKNGQVTAPLIHASSGHELFERAALETLSKWQYQPAMNDGVAVAQSFNGVQINFRLNNDNNYDDNQRRSDVNKRFLSRFQKGMAAIEKGDLKEAAKKIKQLQSREKSKWIENSYLWVLEGYYFEKIGDTVNAAKSFSKVMDNGSQVLPRAVYVEVLKKAFRANIMSNKLQGASAVYQHFQEYAPEHDALQSLTPYYQQAQAFLTGEQPLEVVGVVPAEGLWHHNISKAQVQLVSTAPLEHVYLRCEHQQGHFNSIQQQVIPLKQEWGDCVVYIEGTPATQFLLTES